MAGWTVPWLTEEREVKEIGAAELADVNDNGVENTKIMEDLFADFNEQVKELKGRAAESIAPPTTALRKSASSSSKIRALRRRRPRGGAESRADEQEQEQQSPTRVFLESRISHLGRTVRFESEISLSESQAGDGSTSTSTRHNKRGARRVMPGRSRKLTESSGSGSVSTNDSSSRRGSSNENSSNTPISFASFKKLLSPLLGNESGLTSRSDSKDKNSLMFDLKMWRASDDADIDSDDDDRRAKGVKKGKTSGVWSLSKVWGGLGGKAHKEKETEVLNALSGSNLNATFGRDKGYSMDADFEFDSPMHYLSKTKAKQVTSPLEPMSPHQHALAASARRTVTFNNHLRVGSAVRRTDAIPTIMDGTRVKQATMDRRERQRRRATKFGKRASVNNGLQNLSSTHACYYFLLPFLILALTSVAAWVINEAYPQYSAGHVKKIGGDLPAIVWYLYPKSVQKRWLRYSLRFGIYAVEVAGAINVAVDIYSWFVLVQAIQPTMVHRSRESYIKEKVASTNRRSQQNR